VREFHQIKNLEKGIFSSGKILEEGSSLSGVKSLMWIHQMKLYS
jgi:hypothetical protein